jgi:hypothetical protein
VNSISLYLFMAIKLVYFVSCHLGGGRVWMWVYDLPMTFTILSGRWVGNTGCPAKLSTKGGHPTAHPCLERDSNQRSQCSSDQSPRLTPRDHRSRLILNLKVKYSLFQSTVVSAHSPCSKKT